MDASRRIARDPLTIDVILNKVKDLLFIPSPSGLIFTHIFSEHKGW